MRFLTHVHSTHIILVLARIAHRTGMYLRHLISHQHHFAVRSRFDRRVQSGRKRDARHEHNRRLRARRGLRIQIGNCSRIGKHPTPSTDWRGMQHTRTINIKSTLRTPTTRARGFMCVYGTVSMRPLTVRSAFASFDRRARVHQHGT